MKRINLTQDDLHRLISLQRQLQRDIDQLYMLREMAEGTASIPTNNLHVQSSMPPSGNRYATAAADLSVVIQDEEVELKALKDKVYIFLETLEEPTEHRIIYLRYIEGYNWQMISALLGYTARHIFRIHNKVVEELDVT